MYLLNNYELTYYFPVKMNIRDHQTEKYSNVLDKKV